MLGTVRALHRGRPNARYANDAENQHQYPKYPGRSEGDCGSHHTSHRRSIAVPLLPRNQGFYVQRSPFLDTTPHHMTPTASLRHRCDYLSPLPSLNPQNLYVSDCPLVR